MTLEKIAVNPIITKKLPKWDRVESLLDNDEDAIRENFCRRLPNESAAAYQSRKEYFVETFINFARDLVAAPVNSVFGQSIKEEFTNKTSLLVDFSNNCTMGGELMPFNRFLKDFVGLNLRAFGNVITVVDKPRIEVTNRQDERNYALPYLSNIRPQDLINWQVQDGELLWVAYWRCAKGVWENPFNTEEPAGEKIQCLWTRESFIALNKEDKVITDLSYDHNWGFVPVVIQASFLLHSNDVIGTAAMDQSSNYIITSNNLFNVMVHELYKHGAAVLLMNEEAVTAVNFGTDKEGNTVVKKQDKDGLLMWAGDKEPGYLVKQLEVDKIKAAAEYYQRMAVENERDLKSVTQQGTTGEMLQQSGFAKVVDRESIKSNLISLAVDIETYATKIMNIVAQILKTTNDYTFEIDKDFDLNSLDMKFDSIDKAQKVGLKKYSITLEKEMFRNIVGEITQDPDTQEIANQEIEDAQVDDQEEIIQNLVDGAFKQPDKNKFDKEE